MAEEQLEGRQKLLKNIKLFLKGRSFTFPRPAFFCVSILLVGILVFESLLSSPCLHRQSRSGPHAQPSSLPAFGSWYPPTDPTPPHPRPRPRLRRASSRANARPTPRTYPTARRRDGRSAVSQPQLFPWGGSCPLRVWTPPTLHACGLTPGDRAHKGTRQAPKQLPQATRQRKVLGGWDAGAPAAKPLPLGLASCLRIGPCARQSHPLRGAAAAVLPGPSLHCAGVLAASARVQQSRLVGA